MDKRILRLILTEDQMNYLNKQGNDYRDGVAGYLNILIDNLQKQRNIKFVSILAKYNEYDDYSTKYVRLNDKRKEFIREYSKSINTHMTSLIREMLQREIHATNFKSPYVAEKPERQMFSAVVVEQDIYNLIKEEADKRGVDVNDITDSILKIGIQKRYVTKKDVSDKIIYTPMTFKMYKKDMESFKEYADKLGTTKSRLARQLLKNWVKVNIYGDLS